MGKEREWHYLFIVIEVILKPGLLVQALTWSLRKVPGDLTLVLFGEESLRASSLYNFDKFIQLVKGTTLGRVRTSLVLKINV